MNAFFIIPDEHRGLRVGELFTMDHPPLEKRPRGPRGDRPPGWGKPVG